MKNILVITPFYPYPQKNYLVQDTKVVYYLCKHNNEEENVIVLYYYQHTRAKAFRNFCKILKKKNYSECLYKDDYGHDVLLFEHPCLVPSKYQTLKIFDKKYANLLKTYLHDRTIEIDELIVHFPIRFSRIAEMINAKKRIGVLHSFDVGNEKRIYESKTNNKLYDLLGFRSVHIRKTYGSDKKNFFICHSGIPDELIAKSNRNRSWKEDGCLKILFVGKLNKNKNINTVLEALAKLKDLVLFHFSIVGDGLEMENLRKKVEYLKLSSSVSFLGFVEREIVFEQMLKNDVFVMTSIKETLGLVYLEAMISGNIVVCSKERGIDGLVKDGEEAFCVDPLNADEIADRLKYINSMSKNQIDSMRAKAYDLVKDLSEIKTSRNYFEQCK